MLQRNPGWAFQGSASSSEGLQVPLPAQPPDRKDLGQSPHHHVGVTGCRPLQWEEVRWLPLLHGGCSRPRKVGKLAGVGQGHVCKAEQTGLGVTSLLSLSLQMWPEQTEREVRRPRCGALGPRGVCVGGVGGGGEAPAHTLQSAPSRLQGQSGASVSCLKMTAIAPRDCPRWDLSPTLSCA